MHLRKRGAHGYEPYPSRRSFVRMLDGFVLLVGIIAPLMTLPQLLKIYISQSGAGVSVLTWGAYALLDIPWIIYGLVHRSRPITITYTLWCLMNAGVAIGAILYGASWF